MCFFGGSFMTLIAAVEAYRLTGWESTYKCLHELYLDLMQVVEANKKVCYSFFLYSSFTTTRRNRTESDELLFRMMLLIKMEMELLMSYKLHQQNLLQEKLSYF